MRPLVQLHARRAAARKRYEKLGDARTPNGTLLELFRHDGAFLIRADGVELMSTPVYALSKDAMDDPRVDVVHDDVVNVLRANPIGFHGIMLDTDNGPDGRLMSEHKRLYAAHGIRNTIGALLPGGVIVYWSVDDDPKFVGALQDARLAVTIERLRAHTTSGPMHTLYFATPRA